MRNRTESRRTHPARGHQIRRQPDGRLQSAGSRPNAGANRLRSGRKGGNAAPKTKEAAAHAPENACELMRGHNTPPSGYTPSGTRQRGHETGMNGRRQRQPGQNRTSSPYRGVNHSKLEIGTPETAPHIRGSTTERMRLRGLCPAFPPNRGDQTTKLPLRTAK